MDEDTKQIKDRKLNLDWEKPGTNLKVVLEKVEVSKIPFGLNQIRENNHDRNIQIYKCFVVPGKVFDNIPRQNVAY